jgi:hypothetical protein
MRWRGGSLLKNGGEKKKEGEGILSKIGGGLKKVKQKARVCKNCGKEEPCGCPNPQYVIKPGVSNIMQAILFLGIILAPLFVFLGGFINIAYELVSSGISWTTSNIPATAGFIQIIGLLIYGVLVIFAFSKFGPTMAILYLIVSIFLILGKGFETAWLLTYGIILFFGFYLANSFSKKGFATGLGFAIGTVVILGVVFLALTYGYGLVSGFISEIEGGEEKEVKVPEGVKEGGYDVLEVKLGTSYTGYEAPTVCRNETYILPLTIKNLNPEKSVDNVTVSGVIRNDTSENDTINSIADACGQSAPCRVGHFPVLASLESEKEINFTETKLEIKVGVNYPYTTSGRGEFLIAKTDRDVKNITDPKKGPGPLDVIVFFTPEYYVSESEVAQPTKMKMFIVLRNKLYGKGEVFIKSINITRLFDFPDLGLGNCSVVKRRYDEGFIPLGYKIGKIDYKIICDYVLGNIKIEEPSKKLIFMVLADYEFTHTIETDVKSQRC